MKKQIFENVMKTVFKHKLKETQVKNKYEVDPSSGIDEATTVDLDDTTIELDEMLDMVGMGDKDISMAQSYKKESSCGMKEGEDEVCPECGSKECECDMDDMEEGQLSMMKAVKEAAPPSDKAEEFVKKNKADFKKRYGSKWKDVLYATANKVFPEG